MANKLLSKAFFELKKKKYDAYLFTISNEHLHEFVKDYENDVKLLSDFTGDTGKLLITKNTAYLLIDGRFTIQAKNELKDKRIKIVKIDRDNSDLDFFKKVIKDGDVLVLNYKCNSIHKVLELKEKLCIKVVIKNDDKFLYKELINVKKNIFYMSCAPLFRLSEKYVTYSSKEKIRNIDINGFYLTSNLEEIAFLTNLRYRFCDIASHNVLFDAFMLVSEEKSILYIKDYLDEKDEIYLKKNNIFIKKHDDFYKDIKKLNKNKIFLDKRLNNYYIYDALKLTEKNIIVSPLNIAMTIKREKEIQNLRKINILDGVAITKAIYNIKHNIFKDEYAIKKVVDNTRKVIGKNEYLCESFGTIVAYRENAAICHYIPKSNKSKKITYDSLLLIDSGGNYMGGTTDITRTISLYKSKIPHEIIKHYTMVLNSMIKLSMQVFPYGCTGIELDIIARQNLYNEYLDFNHGTGHGIGYVSNVHEGPCKITPGIYGNYNENILEEGQMISDEPGLYFEGRYGIRIENDLLVRDDKNNRFGEFMSFETLTLCPYERELIDKKYLDKNVIVFLNEYNALVYKKLGKYLTSKEKLWLKSMTKKI